ncbi:SMC-Scp complex subunit ScpB [Cardiobacterium sp. Marseille-Q4385]|uniref:SMC-Scp complex subunit ScpB n=1 Tax=Cardiobacterium sp. Marseille-Q4385 TaxID=2866573 RepID=UPI001CE3C2F2|nr:SMC-Scp complex subunit ScpB [Cardiobacterium sp. Marseille-Q4385]
MNLSRRIEAILFTRDEAVSTAQLAQALATSEDAVCTALDDLAARYETSAMTLVQVKDGWRLQLRSDYFEAVAAFAEAQPVRYSRAFWETLAYIAYHQPVTRAEIDAVRGVTTSSGIYRQLFDLEWIEVIGTKEVPGRPELLATTTQFLNDFSVASLDALPALPEEDGDPA